MNISENAKSTSEAVCALLGVTPDKDQIEGVNQVIERSLINAVLGEAERYTHVIMKCCSADQDTAHKLTDEIRRSNDVLVTNLSSLR